MTVNLPTFTAIHHKFAIKKQVSHALFVKAQQKQRKLAAEKNAKAIPIEAIGRECRRTRGVSATNPLGCVVHPTLSDAFFIFSASDELVSIAGSSVRSKGTCR